MLTVIVTCIYVLKVPNKSSYELKPRVFPLTCYKSKNLHGVPYGSRSKRRLFPQTALPDCSL
jgi:hypothetical protein